MDSHTSFVHYNISYVYIMHNMQSHNTTLTARYHNTCLPVTRANRFDDTHSTAALGSCFIYHRNTVIMYIEIPNLPLIVISYIRVLYGLPYGIKKPAKLVVYRELFDDFQLGQIWPSSAGVTHQRVAPSSG